MRFNRDAGASTRAIHSMAMSDNPLLTSLLAAVDAAPDDVPLRMHVAEVLAGADRLPEARTAPKRFSARRVTPPRSRCCSA
jgi:hypothetical protein